jgi:hypothetical protein
LSATRPPYRLFKIGGIGWATFLGFPLAGGILLAVNSQRLGIPTLARQQLMVTGFGTAALVGVGIVMMLAHGSPWTEAALRGGAIGALMGTITYARRAQGAAINLHRSLGGGLSSNWKAVGIGLLTLIGSVVLTAGIAMVLMAAGLFNLETDGHLAANLPVPSELRLPSGWHVQERTLSDAGLNYSIHHYAYGIRQGAIDLSITEPAGRSLAEYQQAIVDTGLDDAKVDGFDLITSPTTNLTIAGEPALETAQTFDVEGTAVRQEVVTTFGKTKACTLMYTAREENFARNLPDAHQIRDSLKCP